MGPDGRFVLRAIFTQFVRDSYIRGMKGYVVRLWARTAGSSFTFMRFLHNLLICCRFSSERQQIAGVQSERRLGSSRAGIQGENGHVVAKGRLALQPSQQVQNDGNIRLQVPGPSQQGRQSVLAGKGNELNRNREREGETRGELALVTPFSIVVLSLSYRLQHLN